MDKTQEKSDKSLSEVYKLFENDSQGQEIQFLSTVFDFLNRRSSFLAKPSSSSKVMQMVNKYIDNAKNNEIINQNLNQKKTSGITSKTTKSISEKEAKELDKKDTIQKSKTESKKKESDKTESDTKMDVDSPQTINMDSDGDEDDGEAPEGNGGKTDKYVWIQSLSEVEISSQIDANLRGKHLKIEIKKNDLFVAIKGKEKTPIINGKLHEAINIEESTWTLDKEHGKTTKTLTIVLTKLKGMNWWKRVIIGDPEIDTSKIQPENSKLDHLDDETRQTVEKMMFDQRQKMKGLPTSKELEQKKILEKFKQQHPEMDFSNLQTAPDSLNAYTQK